jgi:hypothetical protein
MDILLAQTMKQLRATEVYACIPRNRQKSALSKTELCTLMVKYMKVETMHVDLRHVIPITETPDGHIPDVGAENAVHRFCEHVMVKPSKPYPPFPARYISFGISDVTSPEWEFPSKLWTDGFRGGRLRISWPGRMLTGSNRHGPGEPFENRPNKLYFNVWEPAQPITEKDITIGREAKSGEYPADCDMEPEQLCARNYSWYDHDWYDTYIWTPTTKEKFGLRLVTNVCIHNPYARVQ